MSPWYDNPAFGSYTDEEYSDGQPSKASFGTSYPSGKGEGIWCPDCKARGFYMWLDFSSKSKGIETYKKCPEHKRYYTLKIKEGP